MSATIFIDGEAGTTGLQIKERLAARDDIRLIHLDDAVRKDDTARAEALHDADIAILCLPDAAARAAKELAWQSNSTRLIDASTAHRVDPEWVYGFAEMTHDQAEQIAQARMVSNPGCYPTGAIALLRPLREAGMLPADHPISINAVSGYTGGGKALIAEFTGADNPKAFVYGTSLTHKHLPELRLHAQLAEEPIFIPSVGDFAQGMIVQIPLHLKTLPKAPSLTSIHNVLGEYYAGARFVDVAPMCGDPGRIDPTALNGTNSMRLVVAGSTSKNQAVLIAVLDNLGKGASGAAVQNLNLMLGQDPATGLN